MVTVKGEFSPKVLGQRLCGVCQVEHLPEIFWHEIWLKFLQGENRVENPGKQFLAGRKPCGKSWGATFRKMLSLRRSVGHGQKQFDQE